MKPLCIDLCCGKYGGWALGFLDAGYEVLGVDIEDFHETYPGNFIQADIRDLDGTEWGRPVRVGVASVPCTRYSKLDLPQSWGNHWKQEPPPDGELWRTAERLLLQSKPWAWCMENVRGAQRIHGPAKKRVGSRYLWGDFPIFNPKPVYGKWRMPPSPDRTHRRAMIPYPLARGLAEACLP